MVGRTAGLVGFPDRVWLGIKRGQWPVEAFISEDQAARWAKERDDDRSRYVVGPVPVDPQLPALVAFVVPETVTLTEASA